MPTSEILEGFIHPSDRDLVSSKIKQTIDENEPLSFEAQMIRADGTEWTMYSQGVVQKNDDGKPTRLIGIQQDITQRKEAAEQLKSLTEHLQITTRKVITAQEEERRRIAQELHDQIGQDLTVLLISLKNMQNQPEPSAIQAMLGDSLKVAQHTIEQVREMSLDLRPPMLDDLGLVPAIRWYLDNQAQTGEFVGHLQADKLEGPYSTELETTIYRVAQEGLTNVLRHANAQNVSVELTDQDGQFNLWLRDDGDGFDVAALTKDIRPGGNLGLTGMEERVHLLGGQFQIKSTPGKGTELYACIPLEPEAGGQVTECNELS